MNLFPTRLFLPLLLTAALLVACSANPPIPKLTPAPQESPLQVVEELSVERALAQAESLCVVGTRANKEQEWALAQGLFEEALNILATLDLDAAESEPLTERFNQLLLALSVEYPYALENIEDPPDESSLAMILMRLGELRIDGLSSVLPESTAVQAVEEEKPDYDVPVHWNAQVQESIHLFQTKSRAGFSQWLRRSGCYIDMMRRILKGQGLPEDLVYMVLIESGFNPNAYSWAHAAGPWQFISSTGKLYDLEYDWWLDERRDPEKSTKAAARYLKDLYGEFDSWPLALAAYNCGEQRVRKAIEKSGTTDFWELNLPRQTRNYVPLFMAATVIAKSPETYGFSVDYESAVEYDVVPIDECTDLRVAAQCCGSTYEKMKVLNPELRRWCTPPTESPYLLKVPKGTREVFLKNYALIPASEKITWQRHKINKGETLSGIARRYNTSVTAIKEANSLRSSNRIFAGKYLLIPISPYGGSGHGTVLSSLGEGLADVTDRNLIYTVRRGDNLSRIARDFGVTLSQLQRWNNLRSGQYIYPGDKLVVYPASDLGTASGGYTELIYTVKRGDTLWDIANDFGVSLAQLARENGLRDPSRLKPGKKLKIRMSNNL